MKNRPCLITAARYRQVTIRFGNGCCLLKKGIFYLPKGIWTNYDYADDAGVRIYTLMEGNPTESVVYNIKRETDFIVTGTSIRTERNDKSLLLPLPEWKSNLKHNNGVSHYVMIIFI